MKKDILTYLYFILLGVWVTCLFIAVCYDNSIPAWISLIVMNLLYVWRIGYKY